jgi:hypothetical protein
VNKHDGYVLVSPWSPPGDWKNNGTYRGGDATPGIPDFLLPQFYNDYANYLKRFCQIMLENGAPVYSVSLQNEHTWLVDYEGCLWTGLQHQNFWRTQGHYTSRHIPRGAAPENAYKMPWDVIPGWGGGRDIPSVRPMSAEAHNNIHNFGDLFSVIEDTVAGNEARQGYDILGRHIYGSNLITSQAFLNRAQYHPTDPKEVWQTEWSSDGTSETMLTYTWNLVWLMINAVDYTIRLCHESAFIWFPSKSFHAFMGDGADGTSRGQILPRGWAMSHFAKYAKETGRVGLTVTGRDAANVNPTDSRPTGQGDARWWRPKITAYVTLNEDFYKDVPVEDRHIFWRTDPSLTNLDSSKISAISLVFSTPTNNAGANGTNMGMIKIDLPEDFEIGRAVAIRSRDGSYHVPESVIIGADGRSAFFNMPATNDFCKV